MLNHLISDGLVAVDPETNEYRGLLAESYEFVTDPTFESASQ